MNKTIEKIRSEWNTEMLYFLIYSFAGWIYEVLVFWLEHGYGFVNRGFLFGPWLPVYGFGGVLVISLMQPLKKRNFRIGRLNVTPLVCFAAIVLLCTAVELLTSYLMEWYTGSWLWDYTDDPPDFQGRIALIPSLRFGIIGIIGLYLVHPLLKKCTGFLRAKFPKGYKVVTYLLIGLFALDVVARLFLGSNYTGP